MGKASRKKHQQRYQKNVLEKYGNVKLADAITHLCEPYQQTFGDSDKEYRNLIALTTLSWNAALAEDMETRQKEIDKLLKIVVKERVPLADTGLNDEYNKLIVFIRSIVNDIITRKELYYPNDDRVIVDFTLGTKGSRYHLQVKSIIPQRNAA
ncbi:hypothetical protein [Methylocucumis oryzae]|uniref:Uncharacterized protein n=1 Tax=Methylocucumis oryzae TaxID=1632867 RepID=A0A0F3IKF4_9GAMM|nr:hypothetical protein [Methylocucumis oryzae]KJV07186.1 hypothetical protein VZ94_06435 [Methylocucumis oryzae]